MAAFVAVTGADGFIGSHLVELLVEQGQRVRAMAQYNSFGDVGWLDALPADVLEHVDTVHGDVRAVGASVLRFVVDDHRALRAELDRARHEHADELAAPLARAVRSWTETIS